MRLAGQRKEQVAGVHSLHGGIRAHLQGTFQALHRDLAWLAMLGYPLAGRQHEPDDLEVVGPHEGDGPGAPQARAERSDVDQIAGYRTWCRHNGSPFPVQVIQMTRRASMVLISPIAFAGFNPFGQTSVQFNIERHRNSR
ncbi:hypothetical protein PTKU46_79640 [Paraburkholderia terrae]